VKAAGTFQTYQTRHFAYDSTSSMLATQEVNQVVASRLSGPWGSVVQGTVTTTTNWDTSKLLPKSTYLDAVSSQHGQTFTQYTNDGKIYTQDVYHKESGSLLPSPATVTIGYDAYGQPCSWTTQDNLTGAPSISKSATAPDAGDRPTIMTDEKSVQTTLTYDLYGRVTNSATWGLAPIVTTYSPSYPWTVVQTQAGLVTTSHLDGFGRLTEKDLPDRTRLNYTYDVDGRLIEIIKTSAKGATVTSFAQYDLLGRPMFQTGFDGTKVT